MGWKSLFKKACSKIVDTTGGVAADFFYATGNLACIAGGVAWGIATTVDETLIASYYGSARTTGDLLVILSLADLDLTLNETIPFHHLLQKNGEMSYRLSDYISPGVFRFAGIVLTFSGTTLKLLSANLKQWYQYTLDKEELHNNFGIEQVKPPSWDEYKAANAQALCSSLSYTLISCSLAGTVLAYSPLNTIEKNYYYPEEGEPPPDSLYYHGPTKSTIVPIELDVAKNLTIDIPVIKIEILLKEQATALAAANTTYGGGLTFKANNSSFFWAVPTAVAAFVANKYCGFFERKLDRARQERLANARVVGVNSEELDAQAAYHPI
jgi:hypothetical protein